MNSQIVKQKSGNSLTNLPLDRRVQKWSAPDKVVQLQKVEKYDDVFSMIGDVPPVWAVVNSIGPQQAQVQIVKIISGINAMLSERKRLSVAHAAVVAEKIIANYPNFSMAEIAFVLNQGINGRYGREGQVYGEADVMTIMGWFLRHSEERTGLIETRKLAQSEKEKQLNRQQPINPELAEKVFLDGEWEPTFKPSENEASDKPSKGIIYQSIEHYCKLHGFDYLDYMKDLERIWKIQYDKDQNKLDALTYAQYCKNQVAVVLHDLNKSAA